MTNKQFKVDQRREYHRCWRRKGQGLGPHGSSTPGQTKREDTCRASSWDRFYAKYARARKAAGYQAWRASHRG